MKKYAVWFRTWANITKAWLCPNQHAWITRTQKEEPRGVRSANLSGQKAKPPPPIHLWEMFHSGAPESPMWWLVVLLNNRLKSRSWEATKYCTKSRYIEISRSTFISTDSNFALNGFIVGCNFDFVYGKKLCQPSLSPAGVATTSHS